VSLKMEQSVVVQLLEQASEKFVPSSKTFTPSEIESYFHTLQKDGLIIIENVFSPETIQVISDATQTVYDHVRYMIDNNKLPKTEYPDRIRGISKVIHYYEGRKNVDVPVGRYDYQWGFHIGIFSKPEFYFPSPIKELVTKGIERDCYRVSGSLPLFPGTGAGDWHRDTKPLFSDYSLDVKLPPYWYTLFIPLDDISEENGTTEFILGSHVQDFTDHPSHLPKSQFQVKKRICNFYGWKSSS